MTSQENYVRTAEAFDNLTIRAEQLRALSRLIEDAMMSSDKDDRSIRSALWLLSNLLTEHNTALSDAQRAFLSEYKP